MRKLFVMFAFGLCLGCGGSNSQILSKIAHDNASELSGGGEDIGTLTDGRKIVRYEVKRFKSEAVIKGVDTHYVYVVDGSVSVNSEVPVGKGVELKTTCFIDESL
jgi:hypothetical protein